MKKITQLILTFMTAFAFSFGLGQVVDLAPGTDGGSDYVTVSQTVAKANPIFDSGKVNPDTTGEAGTLIGKIKQIANVFAAVVLAVSIIAFIYGGLKYILSGGNPQSAEQGKMVVIYSGIGIVIALSAFGLGKLFTMFQF